MLNDSVKKKVDIIPGDEGWWKSRSQEVYYRLAQRLVELGMGEEEIDTFLRDAYYAAADCFGG